MTTAYDQQRERSRERQAEQSKAGRDIGKLPPVKNKRRRKACEKNFCKYCETYFPRSFRLKWSPDHLKVLKKVEIIVLKGGTFAMAMPRGNGKTTICERAILWAIAYGHHRYGVLIAADDVKAQKSLGKIKKEIETNDLLAADFPELCLPIRELERIANRAKGQTIGGVPTGVELGKKRLIFAEVEGSPSSGAIIEVGGITGAVRGASHVLDSGDTIRPTLALVDDPQTRRSAKSESQCETRMAIVKTDIVFLTGPDEPISVLMPCTVIYPGDMADRMLNRKEFPEWHGVRTKLLNYFPKRMDLWEQYHELRADELENDGDGRRATAFYRKHRKAMDEGAEVAWEQRKTKYELSALQFAMNLYLFNPAGFWSECQNDPHIEGEDDGDLLSVEDIPLKVHAQRRGRMPLAAQRVTAFIDCHQRLLYWAVMAWEDNFTGYLLDYGAFPDQKQKHFVMRNSRSTLQQKFKKCGVEGALLKGLKEIAGNLLDQQWQREDGTEFRIERLLIDAGWKDDVVKKFCREAKRPELLTSFGRHVGAKRTAFSDLARKPGERVGHHWRVRTDNDHRVRYALLDVNYWKSFLHARLSTSIGDRGSVSLFNAETGKVRTGRQNRITHRMLAEHLRAEKRTRVEADGRKVDEWDLPSSKPDNHLFDCVVGATAAASIQGVKLADVSAESQPRPKKRRKRKASFL